MTPEETRAYNSAYYQANKLKWRKYRGNPNSKHTPEYKRAYRLEKLVAMAGRPYPDVEKCEICEGPPGGGKGKRLAYDHDHATGLFRGWLCEKCNRGIGLLGDSPQVLAKAIVYLQQRMA